MSSLSDAVSGMTAGSWRQITASPYAVQKPPDSIFNPADQDVGDTLLDFLWNMQWDELGSRILFLNSGGHSSPKWFVQYSEALNLWSTLWSGEGFHNYAENCITDASHGSIFYRGGGGTGNPPYQYWNGSTWVQSGSNYPIYIGEHALAYVPTTDAFYLKVEANVYRQYRTVAGWTTLTTSLPNQFGVWHSNAIYCPVVNRLIVGDGNGTSFRMTPGNDTVFTLNNTGPRLDYNAVAADPSTGTLIVIEQGAGLGWRLNPTTGVWTRDIANPLNVGSLSDVVVACPCSTYGVILFIAEPRSGGNGEVYAYAHSATAGMSPLLSNADATYATADDFHATTRGAPFDVGCYETT